MATKPRAGHQHGGCASQDPRHISASPQARLHCMHVQASTTRTLCGTSTQWKHELHSIVLAEVWRADGAQRLTQQIQHTAVGCGSHRSSRDTGDVVVDAQIEQVAEEVRRRRRRRRAWRRRLWRPGRSLLRGSGLAVCPQPRIWAARAGLDANWVRTN